jgi:hypothetical protein
LDDTIEHPTDDEDRANRLYRYVDQEQLHKDRDGLVELQKLTSYGGAPPSTTVIEALFPWIPVTKKTAAEKAEIERWLAVRKEAALEIDPDTAEIHHSHTRYFDPYNVLEPDSKAYARARRLRANWMAARVTKAVRVSARFS